MKYSNDEWAKCRWKLDSIPEGVECYQHYPELQDLFKPIVKAYVETDSVTISLDQLIRYVVLVYHRYSPYAKNEQNIIKRKIDVCEFIGLDVNSAETVKIIANKNQFVNNSALYFLKQEGDMDWLELNEYLEAYYQIMAALTDGSMQEGNKTAQDIAKVKLGIVKEMKSIKAEIEQLSAKVFKDDSDLLNHVERYKKAEEENFVVLSPEDFIRSTRVAE
jgi:translation initiation factor 2B subunit (eIF-2B alpha/beta/delta family)